MGISFYLNKMGFYVNGDFIWKEIYVNYIRDIIVYHCVSVDEENLGGLYFADFYVFYGLVNSRGDFENLQNLDSVTAVYLFTEGSRKNRFFIPNQVSNEFGLMEVVTFQTDYPFYQDRDFYSVSIFQKFFKFKVDDKSVIDNSYFISCKFKFYQYIGDSFSFLLYGRATNNLDIFNNDPDIINICMKFKNSNNGYVEFDIVIKVNNIIITTFSNNLTDMIYITLAFKVENTINSKKLFINQYKDGISTNNYTDDLDFSNFTKEDIHFFGFPTTNKIDLGYFRIEEYSILKTSVNFNSNNISTNTNGLYTNYTDNYNQRRFSEFDTFNLILNSSNEKYISYCGNGCAKCDPLTSKCLSCLTDIF